MLIKQQVNERYPEFISNVIKDRTSPDGILFKECEPEDMLEFFLDYIHTNGFEDRPIDYFNVLKDIYADFRWSKATVMAVPIETLQKDRIRRFLR
jgi:hypothetical protein